MAQQRCYPIDAITCRGGIVQLRKSNLHIPASHVQNDIVYSSWFFECKMILIILHKIDVNDIVVILCNETSYRVSLATLPTSFNNKRFLASISIPFTKYFVNFPLNRYHFSKRLLLWIIHFFKRLSWRKYKHNYRKDKLFVKNYIDICLRLMPINFSRRLFLYSWCLLYLQREFQTIRSSLIANSTNLWHQLICKIALP